MILDALMNALLRFEYDLCEHFFGTHNRTFLAKRKCYFVARRPLPNEKYGEIEHTYAQTSRMHTNKAIKASKLCLLLFSKICGSY